MQLPNFPNSIFRVSVSTGDVSGGPVATVTEIPAKYNDRTISTANSRRIAKDKLGVIETIAESNSLHIVRMWVASADETTEAAAKMLTYVINQCQRKLVAIQRVQAGLMVPMATRVREWNDD